MNVRRQRGLAMVEMAIVATLVMVALFAVLEIGRAFFVINALEEATRRGARVAAVCAVSDPAIERIAIFSDSAGSGPSPLVHNLTVSNVAVDYVGDDGSVLADPVASYLDIGYVRVSIVNYQHDLLIPWLMTSVSMPPFTTTLPRESLGVSPEGVTSC